MASGKVGNVYHALQADGSYKYKYDDQYK